MMEQEQDAEVALIHLNLLKLEFETNTKELKALKLSLDDALDQDTVVKSSDSKILLAKLQALLTLKKQYGDLVKAFNIQFGLKNKSETANVNEAFGDVVDAFYILKPGVESLIRRLKQIQATNANDKEETHQNDDGEEQDEETKRKEELSEKLDSDTDGMEGEKKVVPNDKEQKMEEGETSLKKSVCIGFVIVIVFYFCLGAFINAVLDDREKKSFSGTNLWTYGN